MIPDVEIKLEDVLDGYQPLHYELPEKKVYDESCQIYIDRYNSGEISMEEMLERVMNEYPIITSFSYGFLDEDSNEQVIMSGEKRQ